MEGSIFYEGICFGVVFEFGDYVGVIEDFVKVYIIFRGERRGWVGIYGLFDFGKIFDIGGVVGFSLEIGFVSYDGVREFMEIVKGSIFMGVIFGEGRIEFDSLFVC